MHAAFYTSTARAFYFPKPRALQMANHGIAMNSKLPFSIASAFALVALTPVGLAQTGAVDDYNFNFVNMSSGLNTFFTARQLFGAVTGGVGSMGGSIRVCYGIDSFQGGRNESTGSTNITYLSWIQGHSNNSPGLELGLSTVLAQSVDSLDGDACVSSLFSQGFDTVSNRPVTLQTVIGASILLGLVPSPGSGGAFFPTILVELAGSNGVGIQLPTTLGSSGDFPLLPHVIFEVQGPNNRGLSELNTSSRPRRRTLGSATGRREPVA